jgi:hypothetical protein
MIDIFINLFPFYHDQLSCKLMAVIHIHPILTFEGKEGSPPLERASSGLAATLLANVRLG